MSLCSIEMPPILFGANLYPTTGYPMWTGSVENLLVDSDLDYVTTYDGTGLGSSAHFRCIGSLRFPSPPSPEDTRTIVLRLVYGINHHPGETEQLRTGLDVRAYVDGEDIGFPIAVNNVDRSTGGYPYRDYYWEAGNLSGLGAITRFELYGYVLRSPVSAVQTVSSVNIFYASVYYCTDGEIDLPHDAVYLPSYPLNYNGFGNSITPASITDQTNIGIPALLSPPPLPTLFILPPPPPGGSPPPPVPPPPPPQVAQAPLRTREGKLVTSVPFQLTVQPSSIPVRVDSITGFYSGDLDVSLHIKPGSSQGRTYRVTDQITLGVTTGGTVSRVSPTAIVDAPPPSTGVTMQITPNVWSIKTGFVHYKTGKVILHNYSAISQSFLLTAEGSTGIPGQGDQSIVQFENVLSTVDPGDRLTLLYAIQSNSATTGAETFKVVATGSYGTILAEEWLTLNHHSENTLDTTYYVAGASSYSFRIGQPVSVNLQTLSGPTGTERWRLSDPKFLLDHNLVFNSTGQIQSTGVTGPVSMASIMVIASTETGPGQRSYAARVITFTITL